MSLSSPGLILTCGSLWSEQSLCRSSSDWFTLFSSCRAHSRASTPLPHSSLSGFCNTKQVRRHLLMRDERSATWARQPALWVFQSVFAVKRSTRARGDCVCMSEKDKWHCTLTPFCHTLSFWPYVALPKLEMRMITQSKKNLTSSVQVKTATKLDIYFHTRYNKYEHIPGHLVGRSFPPSGSAVSWASQRAHAPRVTDDGRT